MMFLRCNFMDKFELVKFTDNNFEINVRADIVVHTLANTK